jgi:hypothetical protein
MSSATSIDGVNADRIKPEAARRNESRDTFRPWHFFVLASLMAATAAVIMTRQARPEHLVVISLTIGAAGFAAAALYRTLVPLVRPQAGAAAMALSEGMRAALEREKMLVLRSIKELEFDRAMGKVSPKDFDEMAGRLRTRAMSLIRQLDSGGGYRELIERELSARMRTPAAGARANASSSPAVPAAAVPPGAARTCACGAANDADAAFCKRCGTRIASGAAS